MPKKQLDPASLSGTALDDWYRRSPQEIEDARRAQDARYREIFTGSIRPDASPPQQEQKNRSLVENAKQTLDYLHDGPPLPPAPRGVVASPAWEAAVALQHAAKMPRPSTLATFVPVVGPVWEMLADLQARNYTGAGVHAAAGGLDLLPATTALKGVRAADKGASLLNGSFLTAQQAQKLMRDRGLTAAGEQSHHSVALNGMPRNVPNWRNNPAFLKPLPTEIHQRIHRSWNGKPRFDPLRQAWYGTTDWMKTIPAGIAGYATDAWENLTHPFSGSESDGPKPAGR